MTLSQEEIKLIAVELSKLIEIKPSVWLSKQDLMKEFGIKETLLTSLINDKTNPLPYTTFGDKKQFFHRDDINQWLNNRKRNVL